MKIIGITGTNGAGKGTVVEYLCKSFDYQHYSVSNYLKSLLEEKGIFIDRESLINMGNQLRANHGSNYIIQQLCKHAKEQWKNAIIESIRTVGEIEALREEPDFMLLAVTADPQVRYQRITQRASEKDHVSWATFLEQERLESENKDPNKQNISKCIEMADYHLNNDGTREELFEQIQKIFAPL